MRYYNTFTLTRGMKTKRLKLLVPEGQKTDWNFAFQSSTIATKKKKKTPHGVFDSISCHLKEGYSKWVPNENTV